MEIKQLKLVKTIAEAGNIANASEALHLTQSALSHQLRTMEERLGFKIFNRKRNQWQLTDEGKELEKLATEVLQSIEEKMSHIQQIQQSGGGKIRVSSECYSFYRLLPAVIRDLRLMHPQIELDLVYSATHRPIEHLIKDEVDIAIVTKPCDQEEIITTELMEDEVMMLLHKEHPLAAQPFIAAGDFKSLHLLIHSYPLETVSVYEHFLKKEGVEPKHISDIPLTEVAIEMVQANMGVMCVAPWTLDSFDLPRELCLKPIGAEGLSRKLYLSYQSKNRSKKSFQDFLATFEERMATLVE